ncbi:hypothetical protein [Kitasatospora sp. GP82]|uniref:hypothetical protein n=1 Tax=Kitasatospora sp. GP82 TaxID=3035089 RepID=UPI002473DCFE|nr:hypothetical protein [Kitasatospora sp. GP82]
MTDMTTEAIETAAAEAVDDQLIGMLVERARAGGLQQPALTGQLQAARASPIDQLPDQLIIQQIRRQLDRPDLFNRLDRDSHIAHQVLLP